VLARTGVTSPLGKLTEVIPAIKVSCETKELLEQASRRAGLTLQEFVRELLTIRAHGKERVHELYRARIESVSGSANEEC
jgi:hypothetical protein